MLTAKGAANANAVRPWHAPRLRRSRHGRLPNFIVIGAMKAGTTSLFHYLQAHPEAYLSPLKEVEFFIAEKNWKRGLDWYRAQFVGASPDVRAIGEASTTYTKFPEFEGVPERIASCIPDVRLIYVVRDPIERIRSQYQHRVLAGAERAPLDVAVIRDERYVNCSRYALQIEQYLQWFSPEKIHLVTSEELRSSRLPTMRQIYSFLQIDPNFVPDTIEREFYTSEERATYPPFVWWVRRTVKRYVPAGKRAKELIDHALPASLLRRGRGPSTPHKNPSFVIPEQVREQLIERLRDDVARFRSFMPEGFDGWGIA